MKFRSPHLQSCFNAAKPILENINETKNAVSEDIKQLETYLKSTSINESIDYLVTDPANTYNINCENFCGEGGSGSGIATEERLVWNHTTKRLIYIKNEYPADIDLYVEYSPITIDRSLCKNIIEKPLIETSFEIRKHIYENKHLGNFLSFIANKFAIHKNGNIFDNFDDDIPF